MANKKNALFVKKNKKDERNEKLKKIIRFWFQSTSHHGFANIVRTNIFFIKLVWAIAIVGMLTFLGYTLYQSIQAFFSYSVVTNFKSLRESPVEFPAVTICNLYPVDPVSYVTSSDYIKKALKMSNLDAKINLSSLNKDSFHSVTLTSNVLKSYIISDQSLTDKDVEKLGFTIDSMLLSCFYNGIRCYPSDFTWFYSFEYGNCYTFNAKLDSNGTQVPARFTSKTGPASGLTIEIFVGLTGVQDFYTIKRGLFVAVHNRSRQPNLKFEGVHISTARTTKISVRKTLYKRLSNEYSNCRKDIDKILDSDSDFFKQTVSITQYTQKLCYEICIQNLFIIPSCGCADPSVPRTSKFNKSIKICNTIELLRCVNDQRKIFDNIPVGDKCDLHCPRECDTAVFSTKLDYSNYPTNYYKTIIPNQAGFEEKFLVTNIFTQSRNQSSSARYISIEKRVRRQVGPGITTMSVSNTTTKALTTIKSNATSTTSNVTSTNSSSSNTTKVNSLNVKNISNSSNSSVSSSTGGSVNLGSNNGGPSLSSNQTSPGGAPSSSNQTSPGGAPSSSNQASPGGAPSPSSQASPGASSPTSNQASTSGGPSDGPSSSFDLNMITKCTLKLSVYYGDLRYTLIEEMPAISIDSLIGLIGGNIGLMVGGSFLTIIEVLELVVNVSRVYAQYGCQKKISNTKR